MLIKCPKCHGELHKVGNTYKCLHKHSFDIAKSGYVNLLLNQSDSGDNKMMINARYEILKAGHFFQLANLLIDLINKYDIKSLLDAGCGEGYYSRSIFEALKIDVIGIDISKVACQKASKLCPEIPYIVSSLYDIPLFNHSVDAILNVFAPTDENEFTRITKKYLIKVIPTEYHLYELKKRLYDDVIINEPKIPTFNNLKLIDEQDLVYQEKVLNLLDLIKMTPYYYKSAFNDEEFLNQSLVTTFAVKILIYQKE